MLKFIGSLKNFPNDTRGPYCQDEFSVKEMSVKNEVLAEMLESLFLTKSLITKHRKVGMMRWIRRSLTKRIPQCTSMVT